MTVKKSIDLEIENANMYYLYTHNLFLVPYGVYETYTIKNHKWIGYKLSNIEWSSVKFIDVIFNNVAFLNNTWSGCTFEKVTFENCTFTDCEFEKVTFENCDLRSDFIENDNTRFINCEYINVNRIIATTSVSQLYSTVASLPNTSFGQQGGELEVYSTELPGQQISVKDSHGYQRKISRVLIQQTFRGWDFRNVDVSKIELYDTIFYDCQFDPPYMNLNSTPEPALRLTNTPAYQKILVGIGFILTILLAYRIKRKYN